MSDRFSETLEALLRQDGLDLAVRFRASDDMSADDEIVFTTLDGTGTYPVALQVVEPGVVSVNDYGYDEAGEVDSVRHGQPLSLRHPVVIADEVAKLLRGREPMPSRMDELPSIPVAAHP